MRLFYAFLSFVIAITLSAGCRSARSGAESQLTALEQKSEPYDQFAWQRAYPDTVFDWKAWRKTIQETRLESAVADRNGDDCNGNPVAWTLQGPGNVAGRLNSIAISPIDENTLLAGFAGGGIFKSTNGGTDWHPVFDEQPELSIGDICYDPNNPAIVYAGTGDPNIPSIVFNGNGIYKSADGGETWHYLALGEEGIVSKIIVDPSNSNTLYAAIMGNPYVRDDKRGVYKSTNGGLNWEKALFISNQAGASSLVINENNPQILYASFWDRIRSNQESIVYGPHARVYKTSNGGESWTELGGGLPTENMGRTGLAISKQNPDKVYAIFVDTLSRPGGLYKTIDGGDSWTPININGLQDAYADFGWYFGRIFCNDFNDEDLYITGILLWRKMAGNNSWGIGAGAHADCHDLAFAPSGKRYLGTDGGLYTHVPGTSNSWVKSKNLPTTQFYHTNYNPHEPNVYYGGAQDNGMQKGSGAGFNNWTSILSADGFHIIFSPSNPEEYWVQIQNGTIHYTNNDAATWSFGQSALGTSDRVNWDAPLFISEHPGHWLYSATYKVYAASGGTNWGVISGDLTDGVVFGDRFHTISCVSESPLVEGQLYAGTTDGNVWRRATTGPWTNITSNLPDRYVTGVYGSTVSSARIYACHSGFRDNDDTPHLHRSDNNGLSWTNVSANLPQMPINDLFILPGHADSVLFVATDAGVYFSINSAQTWKRLGDNMPFIPVFDLEHNPVRKELLAATFARGIWTFPLDSIFIQGANTNTIALSGNIQTETGQGIGNVKVNSTFPTTPNGVFGLSGVPGCDSITLSPSRNDNPLNGVTTFDLVLISKHILNLQALSSPYQLIAADANHSGSITTFDIVTLRKLLLGIDTFLTGNTSWRFVPKSYPFPDPSNPFLYSFPESIKLLTGAQSMTGIDFVGIKTGDVNLSADPSFSNPPEWRRQMDNWPVFYQAKTENGQLMVDFYTDASRMAALQMTLKYDPTAFRLKSVQPLQPFIGPENFNLLRLAQGEIPLAFENTGATDVQSALFRLVFEVNQTQTFTCNTIQEPTPPLFYQQDGHAFRPKLMPSPNDKDQPLWYPNPFGGNGIWLKVPEGVDALDIQISDVNGHVIYRKNCHTSEALQHIDAAVFPYSGLYFYQLQTEHAQWQGKIRFEEN